jgi:molybdate-binding protein
MPGMPVVLVEWAWRIQGLVVPAGNPKGLARLGDLEGLTLMPRQERSGSYLLLDHLMRQAGLEPVRVRFLAPPARSEADVALAIAEGKADAGFAIETVARQFRLDFVPLFRERYDLAVWRRDYFEPPLQKLLAFCRTLAFRERAEELGGYDVAGLGQVHYNGP